MPTVRIGTFNLENLLARYQFNKNIDPRKAVVDGWRADQRHFDIYDETSKKITAQTIRAADAHILALQEVENLDTLKRFRDLYLGGRKAYPYVVAIDGNDPRLIDVAVLSRYPLVNIRTYQHLWVPAWTGCRRTSGGRTSSRATQSARSRPRIASLITSC